MVADNDAPLPDPFKVGAVVAKRYEVVKRLGDGGMGVVYEVKDREELSKSKPFALKVMRTDLPAEQTRQLRAQFKSEVAALRKVKGCQNIVQIHDWCRDQGNPFIVTELLEGMDLKSHLEAYGTIQPDLTVRLLGMLAAGLEEMHAVGLVHRDLKPANIFVVWRRDKYTDIKILDLGIAKDLGNGNTSTAKGTQGYMPPEQWSGSVDQKADVYALGMVANDMLYGLEPEDGPLSTKRTDFAIEGAFKPWFLKATARNKQERFESAEQAIEELAKALNVALPTGPISLPPSIGPVSLRSVPRRHRTRRSWLAAVGAAAVLLALPMVAARSWNYPSLNSSVATTGSVSKASAPALPATQGQVPAAGSTATAAVTAPATVEPSATPVPPGPELRHRVAAKSLAAAAARPIAPAEPTPAGPANALAVAQPAPPRPTKPPSFTY